MKKGETLNPNGRPKKIYTIIKESGYTKDDIRAAFEEAGWQTKEELEAIIEDETKPVILKVISRAFLKGAEKGDYRYISEIMQQAIGKPKESVDSQIKQEIKVTFAKFDINGNSATRTTPDADTSLTE